MTIIESIFLGILEGLTEFFPVSSTGHLIIAEHFINISNPSLFFNTVIQLGAIAAVCWYYRKKISTIWSGFIHKPFSNNSAILLAVASVPVLIVGLLFHSAISSFQRNPHLVAYTTIGIAFVMMFAEYFSKKSITYSNKEKKQTMLDYVVIGLFQACSVVPGVSRSGMTIAGGILRKFSFKNAMETAFILGIPSMGAAALYETLLMFKTNEIVDTSMLLYTFVAGATAFFTALFTIHNTLPILQKYGFFPFVLYRIALGTLLLLAL